MKFATSLSALLSLLISSQLCAAEPEPPALTGDYLRLQGRWVVLKNELRTIDISEMHGRIFIFEGKAFRVDTDKGREGYSLDEKINPKSVDFDDGYSAVIRGIYKLEGESLVLCTGAPGAERPKEFKTSIWTGTILTELKRAK